MLSRDFDPLETEQLFSLKNLIDQIVKSGLQADECISWSQELRNQLDLCKKIIIAEFANLGAQSSSQSYRPGDSDNEEVKEPVRNENQAGAFNLLQTAKSVDFEEIAGIKTQE